MDVYFTGTLLNKLLLLCTQEKLDDLSVTKEALDAPNVPKRHG